MVYIFVTSRYPGHKRRDVIKISQEMLQKHPPNSFPGKLIIPLAFRPTIDNVESVSIREVKDQEKVTEALYRTANAMRIFLDIEGFQYSLDVYASLDDAKNMRQLEPD